MAAVVLPLLLLVAVADLAWDATAQCPSVTLLGGTLSGACTAPRTGDVCTYAGCSPGLELSGPAPASSGELALTCTVFGNHAGVRRTCEPCPPDAFKAGAGTEVCQPTLVCVAGQFVAVPATASSDTVCLPCPEGQFVPMGGLPGCVQCAPGQFQNEQGQSSCKACPATEFQSEFGQRSCSQCQTGFFSADQMSEQRCAAGSECDGRCATQLCPAGRFQDEEGEVACKVCAAGTFQDEQGLTTCKACPPNTFQNNRGSTGCTTCNPGRRPTADQAGQVDCVGGEACLNCVLTVCGPGEFSFGTRNTACTPCSPGEFQSGTGQTLCDACPAGSFQNEVARASCKLCDGISGFQDEEGRPACKPLATCPAGQEPDPAQPPTATTDRRCRDIAACLEAPPVCSGLVDNPPSGTAFVTARFSLSDLNGAVGANERAAVREVVSDLLGVPLATVASIAASSSAAGQSAARVATPQSDAPTTASRLDSVVRSSAFVAQLQDKSVVFTSATTATPTEAVSTTQHIDEDLCCAPASTTPAATTAAAPGTSQQQLLDDGDGNGDDSSVSPAVAGGVGAAAAVLVLLLAVGGVLHTRHKRANRRVDLENPSTATQLNSSFGATADGSLEMVALARKQAEYAVPDGGDWGFPDAAASNGNGSGTDSGNGTVDTIRNFYEYMALTRPKAGAGIYDMGGNDSGRASLASRGSGGSGFGSGGGPVVHTSGVHLYASADDDGSPLGEGAVPIVSVASPLYERLDGDDEGTPTLAPAPGRASAVPSVYEMPRISFKRKGSHWDADEYDVTPQTLA